MDRIKAWIRGLRIGEKIAVIFAAPIFIILVIFKMIQTFRDAMESSRKRQADRRASELEREGSRLGGVASEIEKRIRDLEAETKKPLSDEKLEDFFNRRK